MEKRWDVLGIGCAAVDDLLYVESYPHADAKAAVLRRERQCGGLTATALVAAARIGATCAFGGILSASDDSRFVETELTRQGVRTAPVARRDGAGPVRSVIVVARDSGSRTIFADASGAVGHADVPVPLAEVEAAKVLFIDHVDAARMLAPARHARSTGVPVVADIERSNVPQFDELIGLPDHLIVSRGFATELTDQSTPQAAAAALWNDRRKVVVVTCGEEGSWSVNGPDAGAIHHPTFKIPAVVDTTGCGDVFHGVYAATLAWGLPLDQRLAWASAAAAIKASSPGGQAGIPDRDQIHAFLTQNSRNPSRTITRI